VVKLTKEAREALPPEKFAVPETRDLPIHDADHAVWAWNNVRATKGITPAQRAEARRRIIDAGKEHGIDTSGWEKTSVPAASMIASVSAMSLHTPTASHPNKMPFSGILTRIGEPSDAAPEGSGGRRVMLTNEAAARALDSLLGMGVNYNPDGHSPQKKVGFIDDATIEGNSIRIGGFIYAADFPEVAKEIKANKNELGFSFEARDLFTNDPEADPVPIVDCVFTGAAILLKDKAAYRTTSINAARDDAAHSKEDFFMSEDSKKEFAAMLADALKPVTEALAAHGQAIDGLKKVETVNAANHLGKVEKHAAEMEKAAEHMDAAGIGGHPTRGHAAVLRNMAGDLRAQAAQGKMPFAYEAFYASAAEVRASADDRVTKAVDEAKATAKAESEKVLAEVKAAAEKAKKDHDDKVASLETQIKDLKAAAEKAAANADSEGKRKTLTPGQNALLAKAGVELPTDGKKLSSADLDKALASLPTSKRFELKTVLARIGAID